MPYANIEDRRAAARRRYANDPDRHRKCSKDSFDRRRESIVAKRRTRRAEDPEYRDRLREAERKRNRSRWAQLAAWRKANPERWKRQRLQWYNARRARLRNVAFDRVNFDAVLRKSNGSCGICREALGERVEFDHIVPLARGGSHSEENLQATHPTCNKRKGARIAAA